MNVKPALVSDIFHQPDGKNALFIAYLDRGHDNDVFLRFSAKIGRNFDNFPRFYGFRNGLYSIEFSLSKPMTKAIFDTFSIENYVSNIFTDYSLLMEFRPFSGIFYRRSLLVGLNSP
jgi:hypothetical protein